MSAWQEAWDSTRKVPYYFNPQTRERRWQKPPDGEDLPLGWASAWDPQRQRTYYYNSKTRQRRWTRPPEGDDQQLTGNPLAAAPATAAAAAAPGVPRHAHTFETEVPSASDRAALKDADGAASAAQALDERDGGLVRWYHLWLLAIGLCSLSLVISLSAAAGLTIVFDAQQFYNRLLFGMLLAVAATSSLGLYALLNRHRWCLLLLFAGCLLVLSIGQAWFAVELFTDNILPSRTTNDWAIYEHIRDSYRQRKSCAVAGLDAAGNGTSSGNATLGMRRVEDVCTCKGDRFCSCSDLDGRQCVKDYFDRVQALWTVLCSLAALVQLLVIYFSVRFALKLRADAEYFDELWQAHLQGSGEEGSSSAAPPAVPAVPAIPGQQSGVPPILNVPGADPVGEGGGEEEPPRHAALLTCLIFVICLAMLMATIISNGGFEPTDVNALIGPSEETLVAWGAKDVPQMQKGEWWRVLTAMWLHGGVAHLAMNSMALFGLGKDIEEEYGPSKFAAIYIPSGVFGATLSAIFLPWQVGVGASGALFGLFGSCWSDLLQNWFEVEEGHGAKEIARITIMTVINLGMGLTPFLDNFAHGGGFIFGFLAGVVMLPKPKPGAEDGLSMQQKGLQVMAAVAALALLVASFVLLYSGSDVLARCSWCSSISCVDTPWWSCAAIEQQATLPDCQRFKPTRDDATYDIILCGTDENDLDARHEIPQDVGNEVLVQLCETLCSGGGEGGGGGGD
jgi:membrane associated rhomboid family serine protease